MNLKLPTTDSATGRGVKTALQAAVGFVVGLAAAVYAVPGVPEAVTTYVEQNLGQVLLTVGIPTALSSGATGFLYNLFFRKSVKTY